LFGSYNQKIFDSILIFPSTTVHIPDQLLAKIEQIVKEKRSTGIGSLSKPANSLLPMRRDNGRRALKNKGP
jgi:hypothetical protein